MTDMSLPRAAAAQTAILYAKRGKIRKVLEMQEVIRADVMNKDLKPLERATAARAWDILEDRCRVLQGRPLPGQLQPDKDRKPKRRSGRAIEPMPTPEQIASQMGNSAA